MSREKRCPGVLAEDVPERTTSPSRGHLDDHVQAGVGHQQVARRVGRTWWTSLKQGSEM